MTDTQKKFLLLRADGLSFDKIAIQLKVSKPTLIQWSRLFQDDINDLKFLVMQELKEQYSHTKVEQFEQLLKHLKKIDEAIDKVDISEASIKDLIQIRNDINARIEQMEHKAVYTNTNVVTTCEFTGKKEQLSFKLDEL